MGHSGPMRRVVVALLATVLALTTAPSFADDPPAPRPTTLALAPPAAAYAGQTVSVGLTLTAAGDPGQPAQPLAGRTLTLERRQGSGWTSLGTVVTDAQGHARASVTLSKVAQENQVRVGFAGTATEAPSQATATLPLRRRAGRVAVTGPGRVVDERTTTVTVTWRADNGEGVAGRVRLQVAEKKVVRRTVRGKVRRRAVWRWRDAAVLTTGARGVATYRARPRVDTRWRALAPTLAWVSGATSATYALDNRPPGRPVRLPKGAPRPRVRVPAQAHGVGAGANAVVTPIPDATWRSMVGRTWHSGCPVGRDGLRLLQVNYWDYTGYRRRGELVVADEVAAQIAAALTDLYDHRIPIRSMYREDRFGWSSRLHGADDYRSMAAGNSSAFNCRGVVGNAGVRSPHSYGRALDLNTWENPYRSRQGTVPNGWWQPRSHPRVAWRSRQHVVVRILARHGLRWTYGLGDTQHFDAVPSGASRPLVVECGLPVCE